MKVLFVIFQLLGLAGQGFIRSGGFNGNAGKAAYVTPEGVVVVGASEGEVVGVLPW